MELISRQDVDILFYHSGADFALDWYISLTVTDLRARDFLARLGLVSGLEGGIDPKTPFLSQKRQTVTKMLYLDRDRAFLIKTEGACQKVCVRGQPQGQSEDEKEPRQKEGSIEPGAGRLD